MLKTIEAKITRKQKEFAQLIEQHVPICAYKPSGQ